MRSSKNTEAPRDLFSDFYGNAELLHALRGAIRLRRLPHAILLKGPPGSGRRTLAKLLAASAVCREEGPSCGVCPACRKALSGIHPDIALLSGEEEITAGEIRGARAALFVRPGEANRRVLIVEDAERLNRSAANALLSVLEEPPADVLFLLTVETEALLLPTIRSRLAVYRLSPLHPDEMADALSARAPDASDADRARAAVQADGCLGRALSLLSEGFEEGEGAPARFLRALSEGGARGLIRCANELDGMKRPALRARLVSLREGVAGALRAAYGLPGTPAEKEAAKKLSVSALLGLAARLETLLLHCDYRVGAGPLAGEFLVFCMEAAGPSSRAD